MNDNPSRERRKKSEIIAWLMANPDLWEGYPNPIVSPGTRSHAQNIFIEMQAHDLFAPRSQFNELTITRLVDAARAAQEMKP